MKKIGAISILLVFCLGLGAAYAADYDVLRPAGMDKDVKAIKSIHKTKPMPKGPGHESLLGPAGIIDTLTWRAQGRSDNVNFGFLNPGDSMLVWLDPPAACSLVAIRFRPYNWQGNFLLDIWDARNYDPMIYSTDSTDARGWWGTFEPITCASCWVPGDYAQHSPLGLNALDPNDHFWGPFPYTVTSVHANVWIELKASAGIQGEIDLGRDPFYIGGNFFVTAGWGFWSQYDYPGARPYNFFKFYSAGEGPAPHNGWFLRQYFMWFECIVKYYENTPPKTEYLQAQNWTYKAGPFEIKAVVIDKDAENMARAGVDRAELVYDINGTVSRTAMTRIAISDSFVATLPALNSGDLVSYWVEAWDVPGLFSVSGKSSFMRAVPENPGADLLLIWDYAGDADNDTFFTALFNAVRGPGGQKYTYELWNNAERNGIDESVVNFGWKTIYISGWGCGNTLPGYEYQGNPFTDWLDAGNTAMPHNLLYFDQDYFCIQTDYDTDNDGNGCEWDEELQEDDFMFDYFDVVLPVSDAHAADAGGYDSVAIGEGDFAGIRVNFTPTAMGYTNPVGSLWPDWLVDLKDADGQIFHYMDSNFGAGVRVDKGHYRGAYLPWADFFAVDSTESGDLVPREGLVQTVERILHWFGTGTGVSPVAGATIPESYGLSQNYPNPFNPETRIDFQLPKSGRVELAVYNVLGQKVRTLASGERAAGSYSATWDGLDDSSQSVASGVYFYRLTTGDFSSTRRMVLMR